MHSFLSAGITYTLTRNCSRGQLDGCGCAAHPMESRMIYYSIFTIGIKSNVRLSFIASNTWRWGGCSDNIKMGEQYAVRVLDSLETGQDAQALANLHNNFAGRLVSQILKKTVGWFEISFITLH